MTAGVKVLVLCDAHYLCHTVVKACRAQRFRFASTLKSNRRLCNLGWQLKAGPLWAQSVSAAPHGDSGEREAAGPSPLPLC